MDGPRVVSLRPDRHPTGTLGRPARRLLRANRLAYPRGLFRSDLAFEVEYVVCNPCKIGWVEAPHSYEGYKRCGLASAALRSLRHVYPRFQWHTGGGHFREATPFWSSVSVGVPGGYTQRERCSHVEPQRAR